MKKSLVLALAASFVISAAGTALAAPGDVKFDGNVSFQYREDNKNGMSNSASGFRTTFTLNTNVEVAKNLGFYARYTYQNADLAADYADGKFNSAIDAFGFKYNNAGYGYVLGSQALTLGSGLIYDQGFLGKHALPYALTVNKKIGATDVTALYAKTNYQNGWENDKFYAIQGSSALTDKLTVGAMYANVKYGKDNTQKVDNKDSVNFYEVSANYQLAPKLGLNTAYSKASTSEANKAYIFGASYKADAKNSFGVAYYRSEAYSDIKDANFGGMFTGPNPNTKGYMVSFKHQIGKDASFTLSRDQYSGLVDNRFSTIPGNDGRQRTRATVSINF